MPGCVAVPGYAAAEANAVTAPGLMAVNIADLPPLAFTRTQAATLRTAFPDVAVVAGAALLRGRRYGNSVLVAARSPGGIPVGALRLAATRDPTPAQVVHRPPLHVLPVRALPPGRT